MRIFTVSDIHIDYQENFHWLTTLSDMDYKNDLLILGGDLADDINLLGSALTTLKEKFLEVSFVPGNHDLWVRKDDINSLEKFNLITHVCEDLQIQTRPFTWNSTMIVPLCGWYDNSFAGETAPDKEFLNSWMDFYFCKWPDGWNNLDAAKYFLAINERKIRAYQLPVISFSHFVPRKDLILHYLPKNLQGLSIVAGSHHLEKQIRHLNSRIHIYGHTHLNQDMTLDGVRYINNAYGYPSETRISRKSLLRIL